jgi:hypothetical protein
MKALLPILITTATLLAADDWAKVTELKSGTELRIVKDGSKQPVLAQMDHATKDSLFVATKKEQLMIAKSEIQRIDYRPKGGSRIVKESTVKKTGPGNPSPAEERIGGGAPGPSHSASTSFSLGSKPDFEVIYRRKP